MKTFSTSIIAVLCVIGAAGAAEPSRTLDLPATMIFAKGPNEYAGDVLEITRGRGATIGWYVRAERGEEVRVGIEYACEKPLNQAYQLSFDGIDRFWEVVPTAKGEWRRADLGTFKIREGLPVLIFLVPPSGTKYPHPVRFRKLVLEGATAGNLSLLALPEEIAAPDASPGFGEKLGGLHPALESIDLRDESLTLRVSGMAMRGQDELLFTTWDGDLFSLDLNANDESGPPPFRKIARGLSEPMGLAVHGGRIFVTEKNEATELIDGDGDGLFETYRCLSHDWPCTMDYHEYLFGAVVWDDHLYFSASVGMAARGKDNYQAPLRGSVLRVHLDTGETEVVAGGLRTPDGMGPGPDGSILVTDNQGEWLPANKLVVVREGDFFNFRSIPPWHPLDRPRATPPAVWLPQGEIAASPTQPVVLPDSWGPYAGQVIFGDATFGGLQRAVLEEVEGVMQGVVFPFSQGFRHLFHRFAFTDDGTLYAGGIARGNDREFIHRVSGLSRIRYRAAEVFEPLDARIRSNGLEIGFTLPLAAGQGWDPAAYHVTQWGYQATQTYGGQKVRHRIVEVRSASVSADRRRVFLEIPGLVEGEVVHVRISPSLDGEGGGRLWTGDLWYTLNRLPSGNPGEVLPAPAGTIGRAEPYFRISEGGAGRVLFQNFCAACHSLDRTKLVGPSLHGIAGAKRRVRDSADGALKEVVADAAYFRESILEPNSLLVDGYPENLMPPIGAILTESQIDDLVDYLVEVSAAK
jgi:mono/diheme cytochrome c family protein